MVIALGLSTQHCVRAGCGHRCPSCPSQGTHPCPWACPGHCTHHSSQAWGEIVSATCLEGFYPVEGSFWAQNKKGSSGRNTGDLGDPKPTGVFLLELERLERGVLNFIPTIPGSGREHQEELLCPEQLCTDPTAWRGQARVGDAAGVPRGDVERNSLYEWFWSAFL